MQENKIKNGAIFVADAHYNDQRTEFFELLKLIDCGRIATPQLVLLGDMFDLLMPLSPYTTEINIEPVTLLQKLSEKIEVVYFEGNHDFFIDVILKNAKVFRFEEQPALFEINGKRALIMHGDRYGTLGYRLYTSILRNRLAYRVLRLLILDFVYPSIVKSIVKMLKNKKICREFIGFEHVCRKKIEMLLACYTFDILIEGHFHQGVHFVFDRVEYYNINSFACNKSFFQVEFLQSDIKLIELNLGAF